MLNDLKEIGFYTLSNDRCANSSHTSKLQRCEIVLTARCNFKCPYCRHVGGKDLDFSKAAETVKAWAKEGLRAIRFSGGEPTLYPGIFDLCAMSRDLGIEKIAISTNGSASRPIYDKLMSCGVNDFSISLDACCASDGEKMAGGIKGVWETIVHNIRYLSRFSYVTVGVVLTEDNVATINDIIRFASSLGPSDIRIIPAAQESSKLSEVEVDPGLLIRYPILHYRIKNIKNNKPVRGLDEKDSHKCGLVLDDMAVNGENHYPCIIYMRESGAPIGTLGPETRTDRLKWYQAHDTHKDTICKKNCLDVCVEYNNRFKELNPIGQSEEKLCQLSQ